MRAELEGPSGDHVEDSPPSLREGLSRASLLSPSGRAIQRGRGRTSEGGWVGGGAYTCTRGVGRNVATRGEPGARVLGREQQWPFCTYRR